MQSLTISELKKKLNAISILPQAKTKRKHLLAYFKSITYEVNKSILETSTWLAKMMDSWLFIGYNALDFLYSFKCYKGKPNRWFNALTIQTNKILHSTSKFQFKHPKRKVCIHF